MKVLIVNYVNDDENIAKAVALLVQTLASSVCTVHSSVFVKEDIENNFFSEVLSQEDGVLVIIISDRLETVADFTQKYRNKFGLSLSSASYEVSCFHPFPVLALLPGNDEESKHNYKKRLGDYLWIDRSIWHRCLFMDISDEYGFLHELKVLLEKFQGWIKEGRYHKIVSFEEHEYQLRMFNEQKIAFFGKLEGHAKHLQLGGWAAETDSSRILKEEKWEIQKRRFLLLDDYSFIPLKKIQAEDDESFDATSINEIDFRKITDDFVVAGSKGEFIYRSLQETMGTTEFELYGVTNVDKAIESLTSKDGPRFDVVLLDYLLGIGSDGRRQTGADFIRNIQKKSIIGPLGKLWIFPVSAFSLSMMAELSRGDISTHGDNHILYAGADSISTPELFRLQLTRMLKNQQKECCFDLLTFIKQLEESEKKPCYLDKKESDKTTKTNAENEKKFRDMAKEYFRQYVKHLPTINWLVKEAETSSKIRSMLASWDVNERWEEYFQNLLYQLAFSSGAQWMITFRLHMFLSKKFDDEYVKTNFFTDVNEQIANLQKRYN